MSKLPLVSGKNCIKGLRTIRFCCLSSTRKPRNFGARKSPNQTTVPLHKQLDRGTLKAILKQSNIGVDEFTAKL